MGKRFRMENERERENITHVTRYNVSVAIRKLREAKKNLKQDFPTMKIILLTLTDAHHQNMA